MIITNEEHIRSIEALERTLEPFKTLDLTETEKYHLALTNILIQKDEYFKAYFELFISFWFCLIGFSSDVFKRKFSSELASFFERKLLEILKGGK